MGLFDSKKSEHSEPSINYKTGEGNIRKGFQLTSEINKHSAHNHSKNKSETLNAVSEAFSPFLETVSDSKRKRSLNFSEPKSKEMHSSKKEITKFKPNNPHSSSTEFTRKTMTGVENYASNDPGDTNHSNLMYPSNNLTFELLNSQKIKSQNSLSSRFTQKNFNKREGMKQSNSQKNEYFRKADIPENKANFAFPFPVVDKEAKLNFKGEESRKNSFKYPENISGIRGVCRVPGKELMAITQISQNKVHHLGDSLINCRRLIKQNKTLKKHSKLMSKYMNSLEKKMKITTEICKKMTSRFDEQDKLCQEYKKTLILFMRKLAPLFSNDLQLNSESVQSEKLEEIIQQVNVMLSNKNITRLQSFLSQRHPTKESIDMSPPRKRQHVRRTSSMKSLNFRSKPKKSKGTMNMFPSNRVNNADFTDSLLEESISEMKYKENFHLNSKRNRADLRRSEVLKTKDYGRPNRVINKNPGKMMNRNLIRGFGDNSNLGESNGQYETSEKESMEDFFKSIMGTENNSDRQRKFASNSKTVENAKNKKKKKDFNMMKDGTQREKIKGKVHHRQVHTLSDLKKSPPPEKLSTMEVKGGQLFRPDFKKKKKNVFRKESINTLDITNDDTESIIGNSDYKGSIDTQSLENISDDSLNSIKNKRLKFRKQKPEFYKTMEDNYKISDLEMEENRVQGSKKLEKQRQLLKESKSKFGKKVCLSVSIDDKTRRSKESREKSQKHENKSSREENKISRRHAKEPPYKPIARKSVHNANTSKNDSIHKMKMSFKRSGSFSKRSRLLRTDEEDDDPRPNEAVYLANRGKVQKKLFVQKTPHFKVQKQEYNPDREQMNEYYDEYQEKEEERIRRANPSEFDSDAKMTDSSHALDLVDRKEFSRPKNNYSEQFENESESLGRQIDKLKDGAGEVTTEKQSSNKRGGFVNLLGTEYNSNEKKTILNNESDLLFTENKRNKMNLNPANENNRRVKSEFKKVDSSTAQKPLHSSSIEKSEVQKRFDDVIDRYKQKKEELEHQTNQFLRKHDNQNDREVLNSIYKHAMEAFTSDFSNEELMIKQDSEEEEEYEETESQEEIPSGQNYIRKISNLQVNLMDQDPGFYPQNREQMMEVSEYNDSESYQYENMRKKDLLSENNPHSIGRREFHQEYMNPNSYTHANQKNNKKYILDSNISPSGSQVISGFNLSNPKIMSVAKKKIHVNRNIEFFSSSKKANSELVSSQKLRNMASIDKQHSFLNDYSQIEEASVSKEEYSRSKHNNLHMIYNQEYPSNSGYNNSFANLVYLVKPEELIPLVEKLRRKTNKKITKYRIFYDHAKIFVKGIERQMLVTYNIASGEEYETFKGIRIPQNVLKNYQKQQRYFRRHEDNINNILRSFLLLVYKAKLTMAKTIFAKFNKALSTLFPTFHLHSFNKKQEKLEKLKENLEVDIEEINDSIEDFTDYFFTHLVSICPKKNELDFDQKTRNFIKKQKMLKSKSIDGHEAKTLVLVKKQFSHYFVRETNRFEQILSVQGKRMCLKSLSFK